MNVWEAILLGLIQGLTEFLPVSSSGHLVIFQELMGLNEPGVTLEVILHFGTLLSVFCVFGRDFIKLLTFHKDKQQRHFLLMLIVGTLVTALIGFILSRYTDVLFKSILLVGVMLLITGGILKFMTMISADQKIVSDMKVKDALLIGFLQGLAVMPGISRSGLTITGALWRGLNRENAIKYSFMLSAPVILGVTMVELIDISRVGLEQAAIINYIAGGFVAFIAGIAAIKVFIKLLIAQKFHYFAYYCWVIGAFVIIYSVLST